MLLTGEKHMRVHVWFPALARFSVLLSDLLARSQLVSSSVHHSSSYTTPSIPQIYSVEVALLSPTMEEVKTISHELSHLPLLTVTDLSI